MCAGIVLMVELFSRQWCWELCGLIYGKAVLAAHRHKPGSCTHIHSNGTVNDCPQNDHRFNQRANERQTQTIKHMALRHSTLRAITWDHVTASPHAPDPTACLAHSSFSTPSRYFCSPPSARATVRPQPASCPVCRTATRRPTTRPTTSCPACTPPSDTRPGRSV